MFSKTCQSETSEELQVSQGCPRSARSAQEDSVRWLKRSRPPSPLMRNSEKRVRVSATLTSQARSYGMANAVDSREGLQLLQMDEFAKRMFAATNADVRKRKGVG